MHLFKKLKDGGKDSNSTAYFLIESKRFFSILLLRVEGASRPVYHTHAFKQISWLLSGGLFERFIIGESKAHWPRWRPIRTPRDVFHAVSSPSGVSWILSFRGPWKQDWMEYAPEADCFTGLTHGRQVTFKTKGG